MVVIAIYIIIVTNAIVFFVKLYYIYYLSATQLYVFTNTTSGIFIFSFLDTKSMMLVKIESF